MFLQGFSYFYGGNTRSDQPGNGMLRIQMIRNMEPKNAPSARVGHGMSYVQILHFAESTRPPVVADVPALRPRCCPFGCYWFPSMLRFALVAGSRVVAMVTGCTVVVPVLGCALMVPMVVAWLCLCGYGG